MPSMPPAPPCARHNPPRRKVLTGANVAARSRTRRPGWAECSRRRRGRGQHRGRDPSRSRQGRGPGHHERRFARLYGLLSGVFWPRLSSKASPSPVQPHLTALPRPTLPGIHTFGPLPPNPHPRYDDYYLSKDVSPALHLSSAVGPHQGPLAIIPSRHLTGVWGNPDIPIARLGAAIRDVIRDRRAES